MTFVRMYLSIDYSLLRCPAMTGNWFSFFCRKWSATRKEQRTKCARFARPTVELLERRELLATSWLWIGAGPVNANNSWISVPSSPAGTVAPGTVGAPAPNSGDTLIFDPSKNIRNTQTGADVRGSFAGAVFSDNAGQYFVPGNDNITLAPAYRGIVSFKPYDMILSGKVTLAGGAIQGEVDYASTLLWEGGPWDRRRLLQREP
jgi:hypothetical protein